MLIETMERFVELGIAWLSFASGKRLKHRIELLMECKRPSGSIAKKLAPVLVILLALMGLTDASDSDQQVKPTVQRTSSGLNVAAHPYVAFESPRFAQEDEESLSTRRYEIDELLNSLPKSLSERSADLKSQLLIWIPFLNTLEDQFRIEGRTLVADLNPHQHSELEHTLKIWKSGQPKQVSIETRLIQTNFGLASSIDWVEKRVEIQEVDCKGPAIATRISDQDLNNLIHMVQADTRANIMSAPKVTCFDGQTATIADQVQRPFVTGVHPNEAGSLQPTVTILDEGLQCVLTPNTSESNSIRLTFEVNVASIGKVSLAKLPIRMPNQAEPHITVQVPATELTSISSTVKLEAGESVVVALPQVFSLEPGADSDKTTLITLTPKVIAASEVASPDQPD